MEKMGPGKSVYYKDVFTNQGCSLWEVSLYIFIINISVKFKKIYKVVIFFTIIDYLIISIFMIFYIYFLIFVIYLYIYSI